MDKESLEPLRKRIDEIDSEILSLVNERAKAALAIGKLKEEHSDSDETTSYYRPEREAQILRKLKQNNNGPLAFVDVMPIFKEIISACLNIEKRISVAYLGPEGTFTEAAVSKHFGGAVEKNSSSSIEEVFKEVQSGRSHYGVVPVENSTEGMVNQTLDCLLERELNICGEIELPIHQNLMRSQKAIDAILEIRAHEQSLAQCRNWLERNYPGVPKVAVASNAEAARQASENFAIAAIAGQVSAAKYGLDIVHSHIEDKSDNRTRFLVLGKEHILPSGDDKTSALVSVNNKPGALLRVLEPFQNHGISLTRIETRPERKGNWSYVFFIDFDGHLSEQRVEKVLKEIGEIALNVRLLGSYPKALLQE